VATVFPVFALFGIIGLLIYYRITQDAKERNESQALPEDDYNSTPTHRKELVIDTERPALETEHNLALDTEKYTPKHNLPSQGNVKITEAFEALDTESHLGPST
jgi:hypothetical protein